jgi:hypothetical protein
MKLIYVTGLDDYGATRFEEKFGGQKVSDVIPQIENLGGEIEEDGIEFEIREFENIDPKFLEFVKKEFQDYDHSKNVNIYAEFETI